MKYALILALTMFATKTFAETEIELTCRAKAKEIAVETYNGCVTDARQSRIQEIREEYKTKLAEMKNHYDTELKKIAGGKTGKGTKAEKPAKAEKAVPAARSVRAEKPTQGVVKALPAKQNDNGPALPVQTVSEEPSKVVSQTQSNTDDPEIIDIPAEN